MTDTVDQAIDATAGMLVLALVAIPIATIPYYNQIDSVGYDVDDNWILGPSYLETLLLAIPAVMFVAVLIGLFDKFR